MAFVPGNQKEPACGKSWEGLSTSYPQKKPLFNPIHILENSKTIPHIWGAKLMDSRRLSWSCPQSKPFIHRLSRLIHKFQPWKPGAGVFPTP